MLVDKQRKNNTRVGGCTGKGFKPGKSGNPKGRPKKQTLMELIREELRRDGAEPSMIDVARTFIKKMGEGNFQHLKEYIEREEGKTPDKVHAEVKHDFDFSKLTTDDLREYRRLIARANAEPASN